LLAIFSEAFSGGVPGYSTRREAGKAAYQQDEQQDNTRLFEAGTTQERNVAHRRGSVQSGIQVVRFHVWQDLTAEIDDGLAPLHATVTLEMTNEWYANLSKPGGSIKIETARSAEIIEAKLLVYQAHYGLGLGQPGSKQLQFMMSPTPLCVRLSGSETVRGTAKMKFGERYVSIELPETKVIFTR